MALVFRNCQFLDGRLGFWKGAMHLLDPNRASPEGVYRNGLSSTKMSHDFGHAIVVTLLWSRYCGHAIVTLLSHYCSFRI